MGAAASVVSEEAELKTFKNMRAKFEVQRNFRLHCSLCSVAAISLACLYSTANDNVLD